MSQSNGTDNGALFVVGAGRGVGAAVARRFGRDARPVGLIARNRERLDGMTRQLGEDGITAAAAVADVRDVDAVRFAVDALERRLGTAEVLCVSPLPDVATIKPVVDTTAEDLREALELGVLGTAAAVGRVLPAMRATGRGTMLFTTGSAALTPRPDLDPMKPEETLRNGRVQGLRPGRMRRDEREDTGRRDAARSAREAAVS